MPESQLLATERAKYRACWDTPEYRRFSPGEQWLRLFTHMVRPRPGGTLVDIGCGTGRATLKLQDRYLYRVTGLDLVPGALETDIDFRSCNLWGRWPNKHWDVGYCCDVMEHIPPEKVGKVLANISRHTDRCWFSISFREDHFGQVVGHPLHLTVQPFTWWRDLLGELGDVVNARDLLTMGVFDVKWWDA